MNTNITIGFIASALGGAGIEQLRVDFNHSMILIGLSVGLVVLVAILNKVGVPVSARKDD